MEIKAIAILANPRAGRGSSLHFTKWLCDQLFAKQMQYTLFPDTWPNNFQDYTDVWIIGGDGTLNFFINQYPYCKLPLVIFKAGTGNDFAWKLYGNLTNEAIFKKVINANPRWVDAAKCNDHLYINCMGIGFDGEILSSMDAIRFLGGNLGYLVAVMLKIFSFKEKRIKISSEHKSWEDHYLLVVVNNSSRAGGGFYITPTAQIDDGKLNLLLCKKLSIIQRLWYLPILKKGKHTSLPFVTQYEGPSFTIHTTEKMPVQLDGELIFAKDIMIQVCPNKFCFRF